MQVYKLSSLITSKSVNFLTIGSRSLSASSVPIRHYFSTNTKQPITEFSKFQQLKASMKCNWLITKDSIKQFNDKDKVLFSAMTLSPVGWVVGGLTALHTFGIPWWGSIVALTCGLRFFLLPFQIQTMKAQAKMIDIQPQLNALMDKMKIASLNGETDLSAYQLETRNIYKRAGVSPLSMTTSSIIQLPVLLCLFWGVERLVKTVPDLANGGCLWFPNLTIPDPYYILPIIANTALFLSTFNMADKAGSNMKMMSRAMILMSTLITLRLNSAMILLLFSTSIFQVTTDAILKSKPIRKMLDIPDPVKNQTQTIFDMKNIPPPPSTPIPRKMKQMNEEMNKTINNIVNNESQTKK